MQTFEESNGPFAFTSLQLAKLQCHPQVVTTSRVFGANETLFFSKSGNQPVTFECCAQIIYTSSKADDAFLAALRQSTGADPTEGEYEVN